MSVHVPQVARRQVRIETRLTHNIMKRNANVVIIQFALPFELGKQVKKLSQLFRLSNFAKSDLLCVLLKHIFVAQAHIETVTKQANLLQARVVRIEVHLGIIKQHLESGVVPCWMLLVFAMARVLSQLLHRTNLLDEKLFA